MDLSKKIRRLEPIDGIPCCNCFGTGVLPFPQSVLWTPIGKYNIKFKECPVCKGTGRLKMHQPPKPKIKSNTPESVSNERSQ